MLQTVNPAHDALATICKISSHELQLCGACKSSAQSSRLPSLLRCILLGEISVTVSAVVAIGAQLHKVVAIMLLTISIERHHHK